MFMLGRITKDTNIFNTVLNTYRLVYLACIVFTLVSGLVLYLAELRDMCMFRYLLAAVASLILYLSLSVAAIRRNFRLISAFSGLLMVLLSGFVVYKNPNSMSLVTLHLITVFITSMAFENLKLLMPYLALNACICKLVLFTPVTEYSAFLMSYVILFFMAFSYIGIKRVGTILSKYEELNEEMNKRYKILRGRRPNDFRNSGIKEEKFLGRQKVD